MKKLVAGGVCALAVAVVAPVQPVQAAPAAEVRCATKSEYRKIKNGMAKAQVARIIGYGGKKFYRFDIYETREYAACTSDSGFVMVSFERGKVTDKSAVWG